MNRFVTYIMIVVLVALSASCGVQRRTVAGADRMGELSGRLGLRVTGKDNLRLYTVASSWLGAPYRFGGMSRRGVDCSGFAIILYSEVYGRRLASSSAGILKNNCKKIRRSTLREGDLVFFRTDNGSRKTPNHMGVYLKNNKFVHASTSRGVIVSSLGEPYYTRSWITGGRVK